MPIKDTMITVAPRNWGPRIRTNPNITQKDQDRREQIIEKETTVKRKPLVAGLLSLLVPGSGQLYAGEGDKGAAILAAAIVIGNLNILILPLISMANPSIPEEKPSARATWSYWIPRVVHDVISFWSMVFWAWAVVDAVSIARKHR
jgi:hypothetical protein